MSVVEIRPDVFWIGVNDRKTDLFEGTWPISEEGIVNNSYFINDEKKTIIDSAKAFQKDEYIDKVSEIVDPSEIEYIIINHMEPDHSGLLENILKIAPRATLIGTDRTGKLLEAFYGITDRVKVVKDGETLSLGKRTLTFVSTPMVHWPETMMTYCADDNILFSGDGFGGYGALKDDIFDENCPDIDYYIKESLRYYTNIVSKFGKMVTRALEKLSPLSIKIIAPSHGLVWKKEPNRIIDLYRKWSLYTEGTGERGITIIHGSMYGNTDMMLDAVIETLKKGEIPFESFDASRTHVSYILPSLLTRSGVIVGAPTYEAGLFVPVANVLDMAMRKGVKNKKVFRFGSYGWSGGAQKEFEKIVGDMKWDIAGSFEFNGRPTKDDLKKGKTLFAEFVKGL